MSNNLLSLTSKTKLSYLSKRRIFCLTLCFIPIIIISVAIIVLHKFKYINELYMCLAFVGFIFIYALIYINRTINEEI